jgi:hypothetical protein
MTCKSRCFAVNLLVLATIVGLAAAARANDSGSELAAGGLVLVKTDSISMQREDLTLSPAEVRVRYEMRNDTAAPVTLRVAFPMPEVPKETPGGLGTSGGAHNIDMKVPTDPNFIGFRVWADGQEIMPETEIRATLPDGRDITDALWRIGGQPLILQPRYFDLPAEASERTGPNGGWDLDAATRRKLQDLGALRQDTESYDLLWTTRITFHWMQTFRPGVSVVEHSYRPILGSQLFASERAGHLGQPDVAGGVWRGSADEDVAHAFCVDAGTDRAMRAVYHRLISARHDAGNAYVTAYTLGYILRTARNWRGPIGTFHLTLQGGRFAMEGADAVEARVMSLCTDLPLRQTAPMRFEATTRNYVPTDDLRVLILAE